MLPKPRTYLGALHVHTDVGSGESSLDDLINQARDAGIDFLILTDRVVNGHQPEIKEGWHRGVLVICGEEISTPEGHLLAFETRSPIGPRETLAEAIAAVKEQCGIVVSIHHQLPEIPVHPGDGFLRPVPLDEAGLFEGWCFMDEFLARVEPKQFFPALKRPERLIIGPTRRQLSVWDHELTGRMLPMVAGLNLHHRKYPLLEWKEVIPPRLAFQTLVTCVQTGELPTVAIRARDLVWAALREGRSYVVNRAIGPERGFEFNYVSAEGRVRVMGDEHYYTGGGKFFLTLPEEGEVVLRQNGLPLLWATGKQIRFPATGPGVYRVEVRKDRRLWILSNPIRLVDEEGVIQPTVSDVT